jgi:hypothetical protein
VREIFEGFDPERLPELLIATNVTFESITLARSSSHHEVPVEMGERLYDESLARIRLGHAPG